jgi:hypothetical protein
MIVVQYILGGKCVTNCRSAPSSRTGRPTSEKSESLVRAVADGPRGVCAKSGVGVEKPAAPADCPAPPPHPLEVGCLSPSSLYFRPVVGPPLGPAGSVVAHGSVLSAVVWLVPFQVRPKVQVPADAVPWLGLLTCTFQS